jgi:hypothetical protein
MNATKSRQPVKAVHGSCRWLRRIGDGDTKSGLLEINGQFYGVIVIDGGYQIVKPDRTVYHIDGELWVCDCPDATYRSERPGGCKHVAALKAAPRSIGLL